MTKLLILDFDGTMTDAEAEGRPYREGYLADLALLANKDVETIESWATEFDDVVQRNQQDFGWHFGGQIVAPACVDPYLRIMPIARMILDRAKAFQNEDERDRILDRILYKYNYQKTITAFRPGAREFLLNFDDNSNCRTHVVTNSHTKPVQRKIIEIGQNNDGSNALKWLADRVVGSAKKYILANDDKTIPEMMNLPGLKRPILLRRMHYHYVLSDILNQEGMKWTDMVVLGDIFELDLCLPFQMGAKVGLMTSRFTPQYEIDFLDKHPRCATFDSLSKAKEWIQGL